MMTMKALVNRVLSQYWQYALLLFVWCGFLNAFNALTLVSGALFVALFSVLFGLSRQKINLLHLLLLVVHTLYKLVQSSYYVLKEICVARGDANYQLCKLEFDALNDVQKVVLANLISLTPGTLTVDVTNTHVIIHDMFANQVQAGSDEIKYNLLPMIKKAFPC